MTDRPKRYAVVSCHVERALDDRAWRALSAFQERRPGGFRVAALLRPPDPAAGEPEGLFVARAREAAARGPLGHHTHFTAPTHARPLPGAAAAERVLREGRWLCAQGLAPTLFCGGGWYMDAGVAAAAAELGYADCTATSYSLPYLAPGEPHLRVRAPAWLRLENGRRLLELPSTHSLGAAVRASLAGRLPEPVVHVHFHDWDLLDARRRVALELALTALGRRRRACDLDRLAALIAGEAPELPFVDALP